MTPEFVFATLVLVECLLLIMLMSPGVMKPKSLVEAEVRFLHSHSPIAELTLHDEQMRVRHIQYFICSGAIVVLFTMIGYGWYRKL